MGEQVDLTNLPGFGEIVQWVEGNILDAPQVPRTISELFL